MAEKKKTQYNTWSEPKLSKPKGRGKRKPPGSKAEEQRRGMAATRKKAQAARPTLSQKRAIQQRDRERAQDAKLNSPAARRSRERMRSQVR
jgi:hypothetical protein